MTMLVIYIGAFVVGSILGFVPLVSKWIKARKAKKTATTKAELETAEAEKEKALSEMREYMMSLIVQAESAFNVLDKVMKAEHSSAGSMKKESVFTKLQAFAFSKGFEFDGEFWSKKIDEFVAFTKLVNSKE